MNRRLPLILVAGVLVLCVIGVIVVGVTAGSSFGAVAYSVDGTKVSQQTVNDDLKALAGHPTLAKDFFGVNPFKTTDGAVASSGAASWLTLRVELDVLRSSTVTKPTAAELQQARSSTLSQLQSDANIHREFLALPRAMQDAIVEINLYAAAAQNSSAQSRQITRAFRHAHVTVDPKYGFWNAKRLTVCPPTGCPAASGTSSSGG
jgi:hypothetical protein